MIDRFEGEHAFLSNFYPSAIEMHDGITYPTVEHAYQAQKTWDMNLRREIAKLPTPGRAKRAGQRLELRPDWEDVKIPFMKVAVKKKFESHYYLTKALLKTGDVELIEGNNWGDTFWGVCKGEGRNELGKILMEIRENLKRKNNV